MALSNTILTKTIPGAKPAANTLNEILAQSNINLVGAQISLSTESLGLFIKNILGDLSTYDIECLTEELYGNDLQDLIEITSSTSGVRRVPPGANGSPQPLLEGTLLSFGADGKKLQILAYNSGTLWFKLNEDSSEVYSQWQKINPGIVDRYFFYHTNEDPSQRANQAAHFDVPAHAQSVQITFWGAGGGGGGESRRSSSSPDYESLVSKGEDAGDSRVNYIVDNAIVYTIVASGGHGGNNDAQFTEAIPDSPPPNTAETAFYIAGRGMPGGIGQKTLLMKRSQTGASLLPQDGLAGELSIGSFDVTTPGRLVVSLAPGGRNAGYDRNNFSPNGAGFIGKGAAVEIIVW